MEGLSICNGAENLDFADTALRLLHVRTIKDLETMVVAAWGIWLNRNQRVFESVSQGVSQVWKLAMNMLSDYKEASKFFLLGPLSCEVSWKKPPAGVYKINVDGATADGRRCSSIGLVIRDFRGEVVTVLCRVLQGNFSVDETEVLAVEAGILLAKEMGLHHITIESNSLSVVQRILSKEVKGEMDHIVQGILSLLE
ncbi:uncharacterized protein LOC142608995 [Castanea sativa]|uniref:uncharacterized protein LOC142608995 n=1 Tax=Castanea sativa TaxID=21020 RepID=UPI003F64BB12